MMKELVIALGLSNHIGHCENCNEVHPHVYGVFDTPYEYLDVHVGAYFNSQRKIGIGVGGYYERDHLFLELGITTGYRAVSGLALTPFGRAGIKHKNTELFLFPSMSNGEIRLGVGMSQSFTFSLD